MHSDSQSRSLIPLVLALLLSMLPSAAPGQTRPTLSESAYARARRAVELRDSLLRLEPKIDTDTVAGIDATVLGFIRTPFDAATPPDLASLDRGLATARQLLATSRVERVDDPDAGPTPPTLAGVAGTAALATFLPPPIALAYGATDYLVSRAKDEVAFGFVLSLKKNLASDSLLAAVLPRSHSLMQRIETETFQTFLPLLRNGFLEDLDSIPTRRAAILKLVTEKHDTAAIRTYLEGIAVAYRRGLEIRSGTAPASSLAGLVELTASDITDPAIRRSLQVVGLVAREYAAGGGDTMAQEFAQRDRGWLRRYFVAFLAHDLVELNGLRGSTEGAAWLQRLRSREAETVSLINQLQTIRGAAASAGDTATAVRVMATTGAVLQLLRTAPRLAFTPGTATPASVQNFEQIVNDAASLHAAVGKRDYGAVVTWLVQNRYFALCDSTASCRNRLRYLSLGAALASANTSEEVTASLEAVSAPVGSFRAKRGQSGVWSGPQSISVLGYVAGGVYSTERPDDDDYRRPGVALPVGVEVSTGVPWGALSLFVPIVDLGPVANARLLGDDDLEDADIDVDALFAPGLFAVFNATRTFPLSFGFGVQSTRQERMDGSGIAREVNVGRALLFAGFDATFLNFRF